MCDFRKPPDYIINPYTNQPSGYLYRGIVDASKDWGFNPYMMDVKEDGVYYICATGGGYGLLLNEKWYEYSNMVWENDDCPFCCSEFGEQRLSEPLDDYQKVNARLLEYCEVKINKEN